MYIAGLLYSCYFCSDGLVPSPPRGFSVQARLEDFGLFTITSANASQSAPEDGISAFIFRVEAADETSYVLQVVYQYT